MYINEMFKGPAIFELGWDQRSKALKLRILKSAFEDQDTQRVLARHAEGTKEAFKERRIGNLDFVPPKGKKWGFGGVLVPSRSENVHPDYLEWKIPVPRAKKREGEMRPDVTAMYNICVTMSIISPFLSYYKYDGKTEGLPEKLLVFFYHSVGYSGQHGDFYFGPTICRAMFPWLKSFKGTQTMIKEAVRAMESAADVIHGEKRRRDMVAAVEADGNLFLCSDKMYQSSMKAHYSKFEGLEPSEEMKRLGREMTGFDLDPHNVDTVEQQLVLLIGLAALCDEARKFNG